jgi:phenylalanine-4-hydroxylase
VKHNETVLFQPEWGVYDMAVGKKVISAFSGPADVNSFDSIDHVPNSHTIKAFTSEEKKNLEKLYQTIRLIREGKSEESIENIFQDLVENHPKDWLLSIEIAELFELQNNHEMLQKVITHLEALKEKRPEINKLISNGLELIIQKETV